MFICVTVDYSLLYDTSEKVIWDLILVRSLNLHADCSIPYCIMIVLYLSS